VSEDFDSLVLEAAKQNESVGKLLRELQEPRPGGDDCIPWLGEPSMKEKMIRLCARGQIAINLRGMEYLQVKAGEDEESAWKRMRGKLGSGKHLDETYILLPQAVPHAEGVSPIPPQGSGVPSTGSIGGQPPAVPQPTHSGGNAEATAGATGTNPPPAIPAGGIFGGNHGASPAVRPLSTGGATSALNLLGKMEAWGITTGTRVQDVQLKVAALTGAQLNDLLKKLPDGITYDLTLNKEEK